MSLSSLGTLLGTCRLHSKEQTGWIEKARHHLQLDIIRISYRATAIRTSISTKKSSEAQGASWEEMVCLSTSAHFRNYLATMQLMHRTPFFTHPILTIVFIRVLSRTARIRHPAVSETDFWVWEAKGL
jgi:hypothetical protein